jgi:hypothetical protein
MNQLPEVGQAPPMPPCKAPSKGGNENVLMTTSELEDAIYQAAALFKAAAAGNCRDQMEKHLLDLLRVQRTRAEYVGFAAFTSAG